MWKVMKVRLWYIIAWCFDYSKIKTYSMTTTIYQFPKMEVKLSVPECCLSLSCKLSSSVWITFFFFLSFCHIWLSVSPFNILAQWHKCLMTSLGLTMLLDSSWILLITLGWCTQKTRTPTAFILIIVFGHHFHLMSF